MTTTFTCICPAPKLVRHTQPERALDAGRTQPPAHVSEPGMDRKDLVDNIGRRKWDLEKYKVGAGRSDEAGCSLLAIVPLL